MVPLVVMLVAIVLSRAAGAIGLASLDSWHAATRVGLAAMFLLTGVAHFNRLRADLIRMVPRQLPNPGALVTATGVAELLGAVGLLVPMTARLAAVGLAVLLVALFPANIYAARSGATLAGRPATPLRWRLPLQILWIALLLWVAI
jgi:uncharacterized membrane protein